MRLLTVGVIVCQITVRSSEAEKFGSHFPPRARDHGEDVLEPPNPGFPGHRGHPDQDYPNYGTIPRKDLELAVTFKAPPYDQPDHWKTNSNDYSNRRTFFGEFPHGPHDKPFQGLYQFMSSIFGGREEITSEYPDPYHYNHNRAAPPFVTPMTKYAPPYRFTPTEPNYIPPPKPIRASVIKLETVTRSPVYASFDYETTPKYYPPVKAILNQVLIENSKAQDPPPQIIPPFKPLPVLPKPEYVPPTTLKPTFGRFYNDPGQASYEYYNKTDYKYPESVQDQLPHLSVGNVRIPYVTEKSIPQIFNSPPTENPRVFFPSSDSTTDNFGLIDIRELNPPGTNRRGRPLNIDFLTTTIKSFPGAVEKVKRPTFKYTKKLTAQLDKDPVERVTNLTVLGFSKVEKENTNPYKQVNYANVRGLISYEMDKLENNGSIKQFNNSSTRPINLNDELSLDAKILKDTNWDGLTVELTSTTEEPKETTTVYQRRIESKSGKHAFWEIVEGQTTDSPSGFDVTVTTTTTTTTEQNRHQTTTEFFWPSTRETTESNELVTTEVPTTLIVPRIAQRRSENLESLRPAPTENSESSEATIPSERTTIKRRYSRRPKIVNFTPYPTGDELQKKVATRNHFPKRQKPNITLAFGNKDILKPRPKFGKDEVMKFSDEDVRKGRRIEKRRRVYKRIRVSTSERPVQDDSP